MKGKCGNCGYEGESKKGFINVCPDCLFNTLKDNGSEDSFKSESSFRSEFKGDGSVGIEGEIKIRDKESAIMLITGIMEQFSISQRELEY